MPRRGWFQYARSQVRLHEIRDQVPGTCGLCRRRKARPESCCQVARLGDPPQQNGDAEFFGIRQLLSRIHSLARQAGRAPACRHWAKRHIHVGSRTTKAFNEIKKALIEATALAQPDSEGKFVLDTDASAVAISGILHQWQGPPGERRLRPIVYGSKKLTTTQAKLGAPKLEMFTAYYFIVKNQLPLASKVHPEGKYLGLVLVKNILHKPSVDWPMDYDLGKVSVLCGTPPTNSASQRRWLEQTNQ